MFRKRQKLPKERGIQEEQTRWDPGVKEKITKMYDKHAKRKNAEETPARCAESAKSALAQERKR
jgi:hypothetical protein